MKILLKEGAIIKPWLTTPVEWAIMTTLDNDGGSSGDWSAFLWLLICLY